jgi:hypothetical protein
MGVMPVEFERTCERRWIEKFGHPVPAGLLYEINQNGLGRARGSSSTDERPNAGSIVASQLTRA